jgi:phosphoglycolate phosphatase
VAGDTAADMQAGRRAGASVVAGVLTGFDSGDRLLAAGASVVIETIGSFARLLEL